MSEAHSRPKAPGRIRLALIDNAIRLAVTEGVAAVTTNRVAEAAGVTKGGLYHHFPSKQALVEGMVQHLLDQLESDIAAAMAADPEPQGRFTRAYVTATLSEDTLAADTAWSALAITLVADPAVRPLWSTWLAARLAENAATDSDPRLALARLAADGAWLARITDASQGLDTGETLAAMAALLAP